MPSVQRQAAGQRAGKCETMKVTAERRAIEREYQQAIRSRERAEERYRRADHRRYEIYLLLENARAAEQAAWNKARGTRVA